MRIGFKNYYDKYWQDRTCIGKIHTSKNSYIPKRIQTCVSMITPKRVPFRILDIGCGEGTLAMLLKNIYKEQIHIVGCDISEEALKIARPFYDDVFQLDIENDSIKIKLGDIKFDHIICLEILEHLLYPSKVLKTCTDLLTSDGTMILSFPNIVWWKYRIKILKGNFPEEITLFNQAEHLHNFTMNSFLKLLNEVNLEPLEIDGDFIPPKFIKNLGPKKIINKIIKKYPNLFGYQIVIKARFK
jgi:2-polyprenyl-3-methyl-5-hydroxy-6-metoxy-1,4-benzoquinol methylase